MQKKTVVSLISARSAYVSVIKQCEMYNLWKLAPTLHVLQLPAFVLQLRL